VFVCNVCNISDLILSPFSNNCIIL
jgi:hypothetical protein